MATIKKQLTQTFKQPNIAESYGPYISVSAAHAALSEDQLNVIGMTVGIQTGNTIEEYWYQGGTTEQDLVKKQSSDIEANPSGSATEILESIGINGVKYSIKESEEYDETQLMPTAKWYDQSNLDANGDAGINTYIGQNQTDGHHASIYEINIAGYSKIKITAPSAGSYISITKKKLPYGTTVRGQQMADEYVELCPGLFM